MSRDIEFDMSVFKIYLDMVLKKRTKPFRERDGVDAECVAHVADVEGFVFCEAAKLVSADARQTRHQSKGAGGEEEWTERDGQDGAGAKASSARNGTDESGVRDRFGAGDDDAGRGVPGAGKG